MKHSSLSGLGKSVRFEDVPAIVSNRGDIGMLVRSMGSDWLDSERQIVVRDRIGAWRFWSTNIGY